MKEVELEGQYCPWAMSRGRGEIWVSVAGYWVQEAVSSLLVLCGETGCPQAHLGSKALPEGLDAPE